MISSIIDAVLLAALAATSTCVLLMYRRLKAFDIMQGEAAQQFARTAEALERARRAMASLQDDGGDMAVSLAGKLNEGRMMINELETIAGNVINKVASGDLDHVIAAQSDQSLAETATQVNAKTAAADIAANKGALGTSITRSPMIAMRLREAAAIAAARARRDASAPAARSPVNQASAEQKKAAPTLSPPAGDIGDLPKAAPSPVDERASATVATKASWGTAMPATWPAAASATPSAIPEPQWPADQLAMAPATPTAQWSSASGGIVWSDIGLNASPAKSDNIDNTDGDDDTPATLPLPHGPRPMNRLTWGALADAARTKN